MKEEYWSRFADSYDDNQRFVVGNEFYDRISRELEGLPDLGEVLELGCGTGLFTPIVAGKSPKVMATDLSESLLAVAAKRLDGQPHVAFQRENCFETSFPAESFDTVFIANVLHVVQTPELALQESLRVLRKGGIIVVVTFTGYGMSLWEKVKMGVRFLRVWGKPPAHARSLSPDDLTSLLEGAGFQVETRKLFGDRTKALFAIGRKS